MLITSFAHDEEPRKAHGTAVPKWLRRMVSPEMDFSLRGGRPHSTCKVSIEPMEERRRINFLNPIFIFVVSNTSKYSFPD